MEPVWSTVEVDAHGISTPVYLPAEGGDGDSWVDENGTIQFAEEFSGSLSHMVPVLRSVQSRCVHMLLHQIALWLSLRYH